MRTNIDIDEELLAAAMAATGLPTKRATVEEALKRMVRRHEQKQAIAEMAGMGWDGDLDAMRSGTLPPPTP
jgi:Arc/MetJ family transcription regulator